MTVAGHSATAASVHINFNSVVFGSRVIAVASVAVFVLAPQDESKDTPTQHRDVQYFSYSPAVFAYFVWLPAGDGDGLPWYL